MVESSCQFQVADAVSKGAKVLHGGVIDESNPRFFPPTVVVDVDHTMDIVKNESFGPVMPIMKVPSSTHTHTPRLVSVC